MAIDLLEILLDNLNAGGLVIRQKPLQIHGICGQDIEERTGHFVVLNSNNGNTEMVMTTYVNVDCRFCDYREHELRQMNSVYMLFV